MLLLSTSMNVRAQSRDGIPPGPTKGGGELTERETEFFYEQLSAFETELYLSEKKCGGRIEEKTQPKYLEGQKQFIDHYLRFSLMKSISVEKPCACDKNYLNCTFSDPFVRARLKTIINHPAFYDYVTKAGSNMVEVYEFYNSLLGQ